MATKLEQQHDEVQLPLSSVTEQGDRARAGSFPVYCTLSSSSVDSLVVIEKESNPAPWSKRLFEEEFRNPHARVYGIRTHGALGGFLVLHEILDEGHILDFGIRPMYRRQGFGRGLLTHVLRETASRGIRWVTLEVRPSNEAAKKLYESFRFSQVGIRQRYYSDNQEDALVMTLSVDDFSAHDRESVSLCVKRE